MVQKILRFTHDANAAKAEVIKLGGRVVHQLSPLALVAELPDTVAVTTLVESTSEPTQPLDKVTQMAVTAWTTAREEKAARVAAAPSHTEGLPWDAQGYDPPHGADSSRNFKLSNTPTQPESVAESTGTPTSLYMVGSVAVGIIMVSNSTEPEILTETEQIKILQEVQEGLDWLATVEPKAQISFIYDIHPITVLVEPGPYPGVADPYEKLEREWRDAALAKLGYAPGRAGYQQYVNDLRSSRKTNWAYVTFFTKYPLNHFAYAIYEKVVMNYANDGWGPDNINRVFAHESCHVFGAADEYGSCSCGSASGFLAVPNNNCINCFPTGTQAPCLMSANTLSMCDFSRRQIGWDDALYPKMEGK